MMDEERLERLRIRLMGEMDPENAEEDAEIMRKITTLVSEEHIRSPMPLAERSRLAKELFSSVRGLGILQELVDDPQVTEIMVNGPANVFVEKNGRICKWERTFASEEKLMDLVRQVAGKCDRVINEQSPVVDARLSDGSRVCAVVPPVSLGGAALSIRKFPDEPITMDGLVRLGTVSKEAAGFLACLVRSGYSILIGGGTSAGKTTFLN
ncbi:MAG: ATPase, T2SS/T4P/T4SS family, partial [bacterium]